MTRAAYTMKSYNPSLLALGTIHVVGIQCMYGLIYRNGYLAALLRLYTKGPFLLPGSTNPILTRFTNLKYLDKLLTLANILFANILDGSTPRSSLYSFQFAGQLVPLYSLVLIEGSRKGNRHSICSWSVIWALLMQGLGYGFVMPVYCIMHLLSSPKASLSSFEKEESLQVDASFGKLPWAIALGYILPSVLMSVPLNGCFVSVPSNFIHQWFTGLWQGAPLWIFLVHLLLEKSSHKSPPSTQPSLIAERRRAQRELDQTYSFALMCASFTQLSTFGILAFKNSIPASPSTRAELTFRSVFVPPKPWVVGQMPDMAVGIMNFFQYDQYIGSLAGLVWATVLHHRSTALRIPLRNWVLKMVKIYAIGILAGPAAVFMSLIQDRDRFLLDCSTKS